MLVQVQKTQSFTTVIGWEGATKKKSYHTKEGCVSETDSTRVWYKASLAKPTATYKLITKAQRVQTKVQNQQKY